MILDYDNDFDSLLMQRWYKKEEVETKPTPEETQEKVITSVIKWLSSQILCKWENPDEDVLEQFENGVKSILKDSIKRIHCANLRTTTPNNKLYALANKCHVPIEAIPSGMSIVVTLKGASYYFQETGSMRFPISA